MWKLKEKYEGKMLHCIDKMSSKEIEILEENGLDFLNNYFEKV